MNKVKNISKAIELDILTNEQLCQVNGGKGKITKADAKKALDAFVKVTNKKGSRPVVISFL